MRMFNMTAPTLSDKGVGLSMLGVSQPTPPGQDMVPPPSFLALHFFIFWLGPGSELVLSWPAVAYVTNWGVITGDISAGMVPYQH